MTWNGQNAHQYQQPKISLLEVQRSAHVSLTNLIIISMLLNRSEKNESLLRPTSMRPMTAAFTLLTGGSN